MASDNSDTPIEIQRAIAADSRDHRRLLLEEWRMNVQSASDKAIGMQSLAADYAQIGLKSAFLANAGALVALPPLMQWLPIVQRAAIPSSAWYFVIGFLLAAVCSIVAYANFTIVAASYDARAAASAVELAVHYGLREKSAFEEKTYKKNATVDKRLKPWIVGTMVVALALAVSSYVAFFVGAFEFRNIVLR